MTKTGKIILSAGVLIMVSILLIFSCGKDSTGPSGCYTLTLAGNGNGSVGVEPGADCYPEGTSITLTANPDADWEFDSWSGDYSGSSNPAVISMANHDMSITANFVPMGVTLNVGIYPTGGGTVNIFPNQQSYSIGDTVRLIPIPTTGYSFETWSGDASCDCDTLYLVMSANRSVVANFFYTRVTISGIISWPGHTLSSHTYAFADSLASNLLYFVGQATVNPSTGAYKIAINDVWDPVSLLIEGQDDVNNSGPWDPIDTGDGWGFYDGNDDGQWNDYLNVSPGDSLVGINITLIQVGLLDGGKERVSGR